MSVKIIVAKEKLNCDHLLGKFLDESHYDVLIESDTDCYTPANCDVLQRANCDMNCENCADGIGEDRIAFKFRKNFFTPEKMMGAYEGLKDAATQSQNRGLAAGPRGGTLESDGRRGRDYVTDFELEMLDFLMNDQSVLFEDITIDSIEEKYSKVKDVPTESVRGYVWLRSKVVQEYPDYHGWFKHWLEKIKPLTREEQKKEAERINGYISVTNYAQSVYSGIAGWYDRYPRIPFLRATSYTRDNPEKFSMAYPFLQELNQGFRSLLPERWKAQREAANKIDKNFLVPDTVFTTITVNRSFRTAAHLDAGDLDAGFSNLLVVGNGEYTGGYLVFPEYRIAVNVRPGDLLLVANHNVIHGNTPIVLNDVPDADRISLVCYFREGILDGGEYEYEQLREQFVVDRRSNKDHPNWRPLWNGITPGQWADDKMTDYNSAKEWYEYLKKHPKGDIWLEKYHPWLKEAFENKGLEEFFS